MTPRKIALFGIFGIRNLGNECTLQAMIQNIRARLPGTELFCICYGPDDTTARYGVPAVPIASEYVRERSREGAPPAGGRLMKAIRTVFLRIPSEVYSWFRAFRLLRGTDVLAMTGTGMLTDFTTWSFGYPYDILKWTLAARLAGCKVRFVGVGVGPIYEPLSRIFIKTALKTADYRSFRDELSRDRLLRLGIGVRGDRIVPDLAFSLPCSVLPADSDHDGGGRVIGLGVMDFFDRRADRHRDHRTTYEAYIGKMCELVRWLVKHNYRVRMLQGDARHDATVRADLRSALARQGVPYEHADIADEDIETVADLLRQVAATDLVISPRFHNLIVAILLKKPVLAISYDPKSDALVDSVGLGSYSQAIEDIDVQRLIEQLLELDRGRDSIRQSLAGKTREYREMLDRQYAEILAV